MADNISTGILSGLYEKVYNPDVLSCLANLSNDEVFTPPEIVNKMLDMLPQELFSSPDTKFLDPAVKTGVFLREIAKRLIKGLEAVIPDRQQRIDHIFKNQLYGIAITELTSLLSRRSLYCSKYANSDFSVTHFENSDGNIRFKRIPHSFDKSGRCIFCGASETQYDRGEEREYYAYEWIHTLHPEEIFGMKFDVIISNPPYQLNDGGAQASAIPIYNIFVERAIKLNPRYLTMIIPARWMTGGRGLDNYRNQMIHDRRMRILHDFPDSTDCFTGVEIKGGVCFFLWDSKYDGKCSIYRHNKEEVRESIRYLVEEDDSIFVRDDRLISIKNKVKMLNESSFDNIVSSMKPYGLRGDVFKYTQKYGLPEMSTEYKDGFYKVLGLYDLKRVWRYIPNDYPLPSNNPSLNKWKLFVTRNWGIGSFSDVPSQPIIASPGELCTETFIEFGPFDSKKEVENVLSYFQTKFFRVLVSIKKQDQGASKSVYHYVPMQNFKKNWTDKELFDKYKFTKEEIEFIQNSVSDFVIN